MVERVGRIHRDMSLPKLKVLIDIEAGGGESAFVEENDMYTVGRGSLRKCSLRQFGGI